jgi:hypothetical protein
MPNDESTRGKRSYDLSIETVSNFFSILRDTNEERVFLDECEKKGFVLTASAELTQLAKSVLDRLPRPEVRGPECPACPPRRR